MEIWGAFLLLQGWHLTSDGPSPKPMSTRNSAVKPEDRSSATGARRADLRLPSLGPHGEGWLAGQIVLIAAIVATGSVGPRWPASELFVVSGFVLVTLGLALMVAGIAGLGSSLTPLPRPRAGGSLREGGVFGLVRHPMYGGALLAAVGWSLATRPLALVPTVIAEVFLELKSRREEWWLAERYPDYEAYRHRVRWRFLPGIR